MIYISSDLFLQITSGEIPSLKYPRIGYKTTSATVQGTNTKSGYIAEATQNDFTYERWKSDGAGSLIYDMGTLTEIDYISIGAHTLGGINTEISTSVDGEDYDSISEFVASSNNAIMMLFETRTIRYIKIEIGDEAEIGIVFFGKVLVMPRTIYGGHTPITLGRATEKNVYMSEEGEFLGTRIVRKGFKSTYNFTNLKASWIRSTFDDFIKHAITKPFFIAWRPSSFPDEVVYGWSDADIIPVNSGTKDYMSVDFTVRGYDEL